MGDSQRRTGTEAADLPANSKTLEGRPRPVSAPTVPPVGERGSWWWAAAPLLVGGALTVAARFSPERVEDLYSRGLYPKIGFWLQKLSQAWMELCGALNGDLTARRPSLSEAMVGVAVGVALFALVRAGRRGLGALARRIVWLAGAAYLTFLLSWGLNHARLPLGDTLGLQVTEVSAEDLNNVALELERDLTHLLRDEDPGKSSVTGTLFDAALVDIGAEALAAWAGALGRDDRLGWQPAAILCAPASSAALVASGISGIFSPFSQEAHVAFGLPQVDLAFTACHEIAHAQGWAREDEANYLAWRVASRSGSRILRKAALAIALIHVHRALQVADPKLQRRRAMSMDVRVVNLLEERSSYWSRRKSAVASKAMGAVNDTYLKSQGQKGGVASYGRMVDLLVAELR